MTTVNNSIRTTTQQQNLRNANGTGPATTQGNSIAPTRTRVTRPTMDPKAAADLAARWIQMSPYDLRSEFLIGNPDGTYTANPAAMRKFNDLPPELAAAVVAKLSNPAQDQVDAYFSLLVLMELASAAGDNPAFAQIFTEENIAAGGQLIANHQNYFDSLRGLSSIEDGMMTLHTIGKVPWSIVKIPTGADGANSTNPRKALTWLLMQDQKNGSLNYPKTKGMSAAEVEAHANWLIDASLNRHKGFDKLGVTYSNLLEGARIRSSALPQTQDTTQGGLQRAQQSGHKLVNPPGDRIEDVSNSPQDNKYANLDVSNMTFQALQQMLVEILSRDELERKVVIGQFIKGGKDMDQATLSGLKANMDSIQGRMDIVSNVLKDAGEYQKNLARKIMA